MSQQGQEDLEPSSQICKWLQLRGKKKISMRTTMQPQQVYNLPIYSVHDQLMQVGSLKPEKSIPDAILRRAKGLAILTVAKVGMMVTYNVGTGLVIACRDDGSWSPPSAISTFGIGWGAQAGGELTDFIIVLKTKDAVKNFSGNAHISFGAGVSAAAGIVGRAAEADLHAGAGGFAACYTYSRSKGAFLGCSLEGSMLTTRT